MGKDGLHPKVARALEVSGKAYQIHRHQQFDTPIRGPGDFAAALGYSLDRIVKAVFLRDHGATRFAMGVCATNRKLHLDKIAAELGIGRLEVASRKELEEKTGYPVFGVSPLGVEPIPVFMDEHLLGLASVLIGAGQAGVEIESSPSDLRDAARAICLPLT